MGLFKVGPDDLKGYLSRIDLRNIAATAVATALITGGTLLQSAVATGDWSQLGFASLATAIGTAVVHALARLPQGRPVR